jgi:CHAD domain-containing protein
MFNAWFILCSIHSMMNQNKFSQSHLRDYLDTQAKAISAGSKQVSRHLSGKPVHELRLATRQARAVFWVLKNSSEHVRFKKLDRKLHRLGVTLGKVREIDVAISDANHYKIKSSDLIRDRTEAVKKLEKLVAPDSRRKLRKLLKSARKSVHRMNSIEMTQARKKLSEILRVQLAQEIEGPKQLHQLRITVKKARYAIEAMGQAKHPISRSNHPMKKLQDTLGQAHDLELLQGFTGKNAKINAKQNNLNAKALLLLVHEKKQIRCRQFR